MSKAEILVVDDDVLILDTVVNPLKGKGYAVTTTNTGNDAIELIASNKYDVVLSELIIGSYNGLEVLFKAKEANPGNGVIVMTAHPEKLPAADLLELDIDAYLFKPCDIEKMLTCVSHCINMSKIRTSGEDQRFIDRRQNDISDYSGIDKRKNNRRQFYF